MNDELPRLRLVDQLGIELAKELLSSESPDLLMNMIEITHLQWPLIQLNSRNILPQTHPRTISKRKIIL